MRHVKKTVTTFLLLTLVLFQYPVNATISKYVLDSQIQDFMDSQSIKAISYGLWVNGKPVSVNALGESMTKVPATKNMHFRIGGVTETILTTLLMQMVEQNKVNLNDKIVRWYPNLINANKVTLKMLANGTSGYPDYVYNKKFVDRVVNEPFKNWTDKELLDYALMSPPQFIPGTSQRYSHTDYVLLGHILSKVSKKDLNTSLQSYILKPLAMKHTRFNRAPTIPSPVLHSFTQDRNVYEDASFWNPSWTGSSGAMTSTIEDLGIWANAWMKGRLLSTASTQQLRAPDTAGKGNNTDNLYFAMGFVVANHWLFQNPSFGGYSGIFAVLPEKKIVFIAFYTLLPDDKSTGHLGTRLWQQLAPQLAPDYPVPEFK